MADPSSLDSKHFRYRILVVDDEPGVRQVAKTLLELQGYEVQVAEDGFDALTHLTHSVPDILITGLRMPNMSGFELLSVVRKRFPQMGVIVVSAEFLPVHSSEILADAFIPKGDSPTELFAKIIDLINKAPLRPPQKPSEDAVVWIARNKQDHVVVTCPYCLRTSPTQKPADDEIRRVQCPTCPRAFRFRMVPADMIKTP